MRCLSDVGSKIASGSRMICILQEQRTINVVRKISAEAVPVWAAINIGIGLSSIFSKETGCEPLSSPIRMLLPWGQYALYLPIAH